MKNIFFVLFVLLTLVSCSEDETATSVETLMFKDITQNSITLKWELELKKIEQIEVYRNSVLISTLENTDNKTYKDTNLTPNTAYNYYVKVIINDENFIKISGTARTKK